MCSTTGGYLVAIARIICGPLRGYLVAILRAIGGIRTTFRTVTLFFLSTGTARREGRITGWMLAFL